MVSKLHQDMERCSWVESTAYSPNPFHLQHGQAKGASPTNSNPYLGYQMPLESIRIRSHLQKRRLHICGAKLPILRVAYNHLELTPYAVERQRDPPSKNFYHAHMGRPLQRMGQRLLNLLDSMQNTSSAADTAFAALYGRLPISTGHCFSLFAN